MPKKFPSSEMIKGPWVRLHLRLITTAALAELAETLQLLAAPE